MSNYVPDNWVVLKINTGTGNLYKVLAGWSGGYLDGDSWRMNSGITEIKEDDQYYYFHGYTGSCYQCAKNSYGLRANNSGVYSKLKEIYDQYVDLMPEDTDWMNLDYGETE